MRGPKRKLHLPWQGRRYPGAIRKTSLPHTQAHAHLKLAKTGFQTERGNSTRCKLGQGMAHTKHNLAKRPVRTWVMVSNTWAERSNGFYKSDNNSNCNNNKSTTNFVLFRSLGSRRQLKPVMTIWSNLRQFSVIRIECLLPATYVIRIGPTTQRVFRFYVSPDGLNSVLNVGNNNPIPQWATNKCNSIAGGQFTLKLSIVIMYPNKNCL